MDLFIYLFLVVIWKYGRLVLIQSSVELYGKNVWNFYVWFQKDFLVFSQSFMESNDFEELVIYEFLIVYYFYVRQMI